MTNYGQWIPRRPWRLRGRGLSNQEPAYKHTHIVDNIQLHKQVKCKLLHGRAIPSPWPTRLSRWMTLAPRAVRGYSSSPTLQPTSQPPQAPPLLVRRLIRLSYAFSPTKCHDQYQTIKSDKEALHIKCGEDYEMQSGGLCCIASPTFLRCTSCIARNLR